MARIPDGRARQFWDPEHLVSQELIRVAKEKPSQAEPDCCMNKGFEWDEAILYTPHSRWNDGPSPAFWNGPIVKTIPSLDKALAEQP